MIDNVSFTLDAWGEYTAWQTEDKRTIKKINSLVKDIQLWKVVVFGG